MRTFRMDEPVPEAYFQSTLMVQTEITNNTYGEP